MKSLSQKNPPNSTPTELTHCSQSLSVVGSIDSNICGLTEDFPWFAWNKQGNFPHYSSILEENPRGNMTSINSGKSEICLSWRPWKPSKVASYQVSPDRCEQPGCVQSKSHLRGHWTFIVGNLTSTLKGIVPKSMESGGFNPLNEKYAQGMGSSSLSFGMKHRNNTLKPPAPIPWVSPLEGT